MSKRRAERRQRRPQRREPDRSKWPIVRAFAPVHDVFYVSGYGMAGIVREQPDGKLCSSLFYLNLSQGGIELMFGHDDHDLAMVSEILSDSANLPPWRESDAELTSRYVLGCFAWGEKKREWPAEAKTRYLGMLPKLNGLKDWWIKQMVLVEPPLLSVDLLMFLASEMPDVDDMPRGKEMAVAAFARYHVPDVPALLAAVRARPEDFQLRDPNEPRVFHWIKPRKSAPEQRVPHGLLVIENDAVMSHAATVSHASQMVMLMSELTGGASRVIDAFWSTPEDLAIMPPGAEVGGMRPGAADVVRNWLGKSDAKGS
jgi:hypothetical protein